MFSEKMEKAMNDQLQRELEAAYIYLSMAAYCEAQNLGGFAHWMQVQFEEETEHAFKFYGFIHDRGGRVTLQAIPQPPTDFESPLDVFEKALAHEKKVTGHINDMYAMAVEEKDYPSQVFLQWFVEEQVEEEKSAGDIVETLKMIGDKGHALLMLDRQLAQRQGH